MADFGSFMPKVGQSYTQDAGGNWSSPQPQQAAPAAPAQTQQGGYGGQPRNWGFPGPGGGRGGPQWGAYGQMQGGQGGYGMGHQGGYGQMQGRMGMGQGMMRGGYGGQQQQAAPAPMPQMATAQNQLATPMQPGTGFIDSVDPAMRRNALGAAGNGGAFGNVQQGSAAPTPAGWIMSPTLNSFTSPFTSGGGY
jgi:hypothetical protein